MKVIIECQNCGTKAELIPETHGNHAYVHRNLIEQNMYVFETDINVDVSSSPYFDFIEKLKNADSEDEVQEILSDDVTDNIDVDKSLNELRIDCRRCGNYIVLTEFN